ncbi:MAG TPA: hypothetical protein V6D05_08855 [Stenomitos sp.]
METVKAAPATQTPVEPTPVIPPAGGVAIGAIVLGFVLALVVYLFASGGHV